MTATPRKNSPTRSTARAVLQEHIARTRLSLTSAPRWDSAVATSLSRYAMCAAHEKGRLRSDKESYHAFQNFQTRMATLVDVETFLEIIAFLKD